MSESKLHDMASEAADLAYAYCMFDGRLGYDIEMASMQLIMAHDVAKAGGVVLGHELGEDYLTMRVQLQGNPAMTVHFDRTDLANTTIMVDTAEVYRDNNMEPI